MQRKVFLNAWFSAKMLVATGDNGPFDENTRISEVIDLMDPNMKCQALPQFPIMTSEGAGGLLPTAANELRPVVCAGIFSSDCYIVGPTNDVVAKLITERSYVSSLVLNEGILWITGNRCNS